MSVDWEYDFELVANWKLWKKKEFLREHDTGEESQSLLNSEFEKSIKDQLAHLRSLGKSEAEEKIQLEAKQLEGMGEGHYIPEATTTPTKPPRQKQGIFSSAKRFEAKFPRSPKRTPPRGRSPKSPRGRSPKKSPPRGRSAYATPVTGGGHPDPGPPVATCRFCGTRPKKPPNARARLNTARLNTQSRLLRWSIITQRSMLKQTGRWRRHKR